MKKSEFSMGGFKRTALRKMSKAKAVENRKYIKAKEHFLGNYRPCECHGVDNPCLNRATQVHHIRGRVGRMLCDQRYWLAVCLFCHTWIHNHATAARKLGLLSK